jgi:hypothetical protein
VPKRKDVMAAIRKVSWPEPGEDVDDEQSDRA